jgi:hypothetical protein
VNFLCSLRFSFASSLLLFYHLVRSPDYAVGIAIGYGMDHRGVGVRVPVRSKNSLFSTSYTPAVGPSQPPIQWVPGVWFLPGIKRQGREADHSPPACVEVKKMWIYTSTPWYRPCLFVFWKPWPTSDYTRSVLLIWSFVKKNCVIRRQLNNKMADGRTCVLVDNMTCDDTSADVASCE